MGLSFVKGRLIWPCSTPDFGRCFWHMSNHASASGNFSLQTFGTKTGGGPITLIALTAYTFARVSAATAMKVEDYFVQGRRSWVRLYEKGGKRRQVPAHHNLDAYIEAYIKVAGLQDNPKGLLFRTVAGRTGRLTPLPLSQVDA
jgi:hypothetical protein